MKAKVFILTRTFEDHPLAVTGTLNQAIWKMDDVIDEEGYLYSLQNREIEIQKTGVYEVFLWAIADTNSNFGNDYERRVCFIIREYEIETED
jgi:hypothetical protein